MIFFLFSLLLCNSGLNNNIKYKDPSCSPPICLIASNAHHCRNCPNYQGSGHFSSAHAPMKGLRGRISHAACQSFSLNKINSRFFYSGMRVQAYVWFYSLVVMTFRGKGQVWIISACFLMIMIMINRPWRWACPHLPELTLHVTLEMIT